ncbi:hypothetical protein GSI_08525 [Ganoderma sinense ZZ0214-1]|uniref:Uncharacterized protein n=1 Tax=Ganoderma sinense ZZ0214-1 TaxID=1077348 RepID=A0A2G8S432_9APHY|nr:hypothetical protein GSI_08525 [Ganoderma sinense ZZ0214-1]
MLPNACRSFLAFALVFSISRPNLALADSLIVDDWDPSLQWVGGWIGFKDEPPPSWDRTLTWSNISSSTVTFTFTGTSVEVFGALRPVGVWSMQSQYAIDGGSPTTFVLPQEVSQEAYNQSFYRSGALSAGTHTLKVTNLGTQLWLDYFRVSNDVAGADVASSAGQKAGASATTITATVTQPATVSASGSTTHVGSSSAAASASATSALSTTSRLAASASALNTTFQTTTSSALGDASQSSPLPSSPSPSSSDTGSPARGAVATQESSSASSHGVSPSLIAGITVAGVVALAILLAVWWWCRRRTQSGLAPYPFSRRKSPPVPRICPHSFLYAHPPSSLPSSGYQPQAGTRQAAPRRRSTRTRHHSAIRSTPPRSSSARADVQSIKSRLPPVYRAYGAQAGPA